MDPCLRQTERYSNYSYRQISNEQPDVINAALPDWAAGREDRWRELVTSYLAAGNFLCAPIIGQASTNIAASSIHLRYRRGRFGYQDFTRGNF